MRLSSKLSCLLPLAFCLVPLASLTRILNQQNHLYGIGGGNWGISLSHIANRRYVERVLMKAPSNGIDEMEAVKTRLRGIRNHIRYGLSRSDYSGATRQAESDQR